MFWKELAAFSSVFARFCYTLYHCIGQTAFTVKDNLWSQNIQKQLVGLWTIGLNRNTSLASLQVPHNPLDFGFPDQGAFPDFSLALVHLKKKKNFFLNLCTGLFEVIVNPFICFSYCDFSKDSCFFSI